MAWSFNSQTPVYLQIAARLRGEIIRGVYKPNEQILSVRQLAIIAAVNPNTVQRALTELENEGLLYAASTQGRFVTDDKAVLEKARERAAGDLINEFMQKAAQLSLSKEELSKLLKEAEII